jgi:hypothetical protein
MGLVSADVQEGDSVSVFLGGCTPFALKRMSEGHYEFLGERYVHGLMNGEAISYMDEGLLKTEMIMVV